MVLSGQSDRKGGRRNCVRTRKRRRARFRSPAVGRKSGSGDRRAGSSRGRGDRSGADLHATTVASHGRPAHRISPATELHKRRSCTSDQLHKRPVAQATELRERPSCASGRVARAAELRERPSCTTDQLHKRPSCTSGRVARAAELHEWPVARGTRRPGAGVASAARGGGRCSPRTRKGVCTTLWWPFPRPTGVVPLRWRRRTPLGESGLRIVGPLLTGPDRRGRTDEGGPTRADRRGWWRHIRVRRYALSRDEYANPMARTGGRTRMQLGFHVARLGWPQ